MRCPPSDDITLYAQPPPPQSSPTDVLDNINFSPHSHPPINVLEAPDQSPPLSSSPPDSGSLWPTVGPRPVAEDAESIAESVYHQPPKAADRGAAYRLARRLFTLDGFKITDVAKHLCKRLVLPFMDSYRRSNSELSGILSSVGILKYRKNALSIDFRLIWTNFLY